MSVFRSDVNADKTGVNLKYGPKTASTVMVENQFVTRDAAGRILPAANTSTYILGIGVERVQAADANYADNSQIGYDEPREGERFIVDVDDASTAGFVPGVERALLNAGTVKAAAISGGDVATVVVHKVFAATDQAEVTIKSLTNKS